MLLTLQYEPHSTMIDVIFESTLLVILISLVSCEFTLILQEIIKEF